LNIIQTLNNIFTIVHGFINELISSFTPVMVFPIMTIIFLLFFFLYYIKILQPQQGTSEWIDMEINKPNLSFLSGRYPMSKRDLLPLAIITAVFLFLAILNLGDMIEIDVLREIDSPSENHTHMSSMYFDEIYFVRTAVEHIENLNPYEISHPPLGKLIIAVSVLLFGTSPFGWRLTGAVFGVLMLAIMYIFIKNMSGKTVVSVCGTLLFGFDFMRFVQTRVATIDVFSVSMILLSFFFMYRYITTDADAPFRKGLPPLALSGIFFGLSFAIKWTGFYAGAGLLVIYIIRLFQHGSYFSSIKRPGFDKYLLKTLLYSFLFFVVIPLIIYYLTYIPYGLARGMTLENGMLWSSGFFRLVWSNQLVIFNYHNNLVATHPFSSMWWQWLFNIRPVLYVNSVFDGARATFGAFGNPVVWWGGLLAMIMMAIRVFTHRDGKALFILIGYLSQLLPWVAVSRILFAYHYFPSTLFIILALAHIFNTIIERRRNHSGISAVYGYVTVGGVLFALFYPALSGMYLPQWYIAGYLKWFGSWPF